MRGDKNAYWCEDCESYLVTVDAAEGTTPMFLGCSNCQGQMRSMGYPEQPWPARDNHGSPIPTEPTHEWYKPSLEWARRRGGQTLVHVQAGGLVLREIRGLS